MTGILRTSCGLAADLKRSDSLPVLGDPRLDRPPDIEGCQGCLEVHRSDWVHLRMCLTALPSAAATPPQTHASKRYTESQHPVMRSIEPGEAWRWYYIDEVIA